MEQFNPTPSSHLLKKMDFFFKPYNTDVDNSKGMQFEVDKDAFVHGQIEHMLQNDTTLSHQDRKDILAYLGNLHQQKQKEKNSFAWSRMQKLLFQKDFKFFDELKANLKQMHYYQAKKKKKRRQAITNPKTIIGGVQKMNA